MNLGQIMVSFGANISGFTSGVQSLMSQMNSMNARMQAGRSSVTAFNSSMSGVSGALGGASGAIQGVGGGLMGLAGGFIRAGASVGQAVYYWKDLIATGAGLVTNLFAQNAAMEQTRIGFVGLLGGAKQADAMMSKLQAFAAATPFEFPELAKDAQLLVGMGTKASDLIPVLTAVGDATAGVGAGADGVQRAVIALGQMSAAGKINAQDMMQITSIGIPAWRMLAEGMHKTVPEVMALSQKGLIPATEGVKMLVAGMEKMYGGQMANQAQTFNGLISTLHDNIGMAFRAFMGPAFDMAKGALLQLTNLMGSPKIVEFATMMGKVVGEGLSKVATFIKDNVIPALISLFNWFGQLWTKITSSGIPALVDSFKQLAGTVLDILDPAIQGIQGLFQQAFSGNTKPLITQLNQALLSTAGFIKGVSEVLRTLVVAFTEPTAKGEALRMVLLGLGVAILAFKIGSFIATIPALVGGFIAWAGAAWTAAAGTIAATWPLLLIAAIIGVVVVAIVLAVTHWGQIMTWLKGVVGGVVVELGARMSGLGTGVRTVIDGMANAFNQLGTDVRNSLTTLKNQVGGLFDAMGSHARDACTNMKNTVGGIFDNMGTKVHSVTQNIGDTVLAKWNQINGTTDSSWGQIWQTIQRDIGLAWTAVQQKAQQIWQAIQNAWSQIVGTIQGFGGQIIGAITSPFQSAYNTIAGILGGIPGLISGALGGIANFVSNATSQLSSVHIPGFAQGVQNFAGGLALVGEKGPELLYLPGGSSVEPLGSVGSYTPSPIVAGNTGGGGNATYILQFDGRELARALGPQLAGEIRLQVSAYR